MDIMEYLPAITSLVGTFGGILASSRLSNYRIEQLEKKVEKHNDVIARTFKLEMKDSNQDIEIQTLKKQVEEIKRKGVVA